MRMLNDLLRMNLQMFAEDDGANGGSGTEGNPEPKSGEGGTATGEDETKKDFVHQSEVDRRISKAVESALEKQARKFEESKQKEIEKAKKEAEEYSQLTEKEKYEKQLEDREKMLEAKERELKLVALKADVEADLKDNQLPTGLANVLVKEEEPEKIKALVTEIKKDFDKAVGEAVEERLKQDSPAEGSRVKTGSLDRKSLRDMASKARIIKE